MSLAWHAPGRRSIRCNTERMGSTPASLQHKTSCDDGVACGAANGFSKSDSDDSNISLRARAWATKARRKNPWAGQQHSSFTKNQTHFSTVSGAGTSTA